MIKIQFDFTKQPPEIAIDKTKMCKSDITLLQTAFYQMSLGKKFLKKFNLEASGKNIKIDPIINENLTNLNIAKDVFKNLIKEVSFAFQDYT